MQSLKPYVQSSLKRLGLYHRLKASPLYSLYWSVADRSFVEDVSKELHFYRGLLRGFRPGDLIFDIGANHGYKTGIFLRLGATVLAVDPDEVNTQILKDTFHKYRLSPKPVIIANCAVSDENAVETMWIDEPGSAKNTLSRKWVDTLRCDDTRFGRALQFANHKQVVTTTLEQLFVKYGAPFFVKIDVEGHELSVLQGMQRPVPYLSFEVNLPEFRPEGLQCVEVLSRVCASGKFNYAADCRQGFGLGEWLEPQEFSRVLADCVDESIEIFWRAPVTAVRNQA